VISYWEGTVLQCLAEGESIIIDFVNSDLDIGNDEEIKKCIKNRVSGLKINLFFIKNDMDMFLQVDQQITDFYQPNNLAFIIEQNANAISLLLGESQVSLYERTEGVETRFTPSVCFTP
jgi:hypothetical protein